MSIERSELQSAIRAVEQKKGGTIDESLAEGFLTKLGEKIDRGVLPFGEAMRFALNESHIWNQSKRKLYTSLAGKFYGRRGNAVQRAHVRPKRSQKKKPPRTSSVQFTEEEKGQRAFMF